MLKWPADRSLTRLLVLIAAGFGCGLALPRPETISPADFRLFVLFALTIVGVLWQPYPIAVMVLFSLSAGAILGIISLEQALAGFSSSVTWIIVAAFLFSRAFVKTGLGRRIALLFIHRLGGSSLQLGYSLSLTDLVLAPVTASNTARTGAIIFPVARSLAREFESEPGESAGRIGSYLLFTAYQANVITSAMFLTAMASNGLAVEFARSTAQVEISWPLWALSASLPGAVSLLVVPCLIYRTYPPGLKQTPEARRYAREELEKLGPLSRAETFLAATFLVLATVWATSQWHGVNTVGAALMAVCLLLVGRVLEIGDVAGEKAAWNTFLWFGGMISLATALTASGLITWLIRVAGEQLAGWKGLGPLFLLVVVYVYLHYGFASMTSQIIALYPAFLAIAVAAGSPPLLAALLLCFFSNLYASLTHYGDGAAPIYYGSGYINAGSWWKVGFLISVANLVVWLGVGLPWWKVLGVW